MKILDESKLEELREIERIMEEKTYDDELIFFGMGTQGRIYVTEDWNYAIKFYNQEGDEEELDACLWRCDEGAYSINPEESFQNEVTALKLLNEVGCPYIPKLYGYKENRYVVKEFAKGSNYLKYCNLNDLECFDEDDEEPNERRAQFLFNFNKQMDHFKAICEKNNIIPYDCNHRENVVIDENENVMIVDLGHFKLA